MTLTLELTPEQEEHLRQEAEKEGLSVERYALRQLGLAITETKEEWDTPLSERWKDYIGAFDSGGIEAIEARTTDPLMKMLLAKKKAGRL